MLNVAKWQSGKGTNQDKIIPKRERDREHE